MKSIGIFAMEEGGGAMLARRLFFIAIVFNIGCAIFAAGAAIEAIAVGAFAIRVFL
jgi:hypothetical protein